jgi:cysteine desulfurase
LEPTLPERIYLDHAATTPIRPEAAAAVAEGMTRWANSSSPHAEGRAARAALEDARARIKAALGWDGDLIFTSGASEAIAIALGRAKVERRLISAVEHDAVFRAAPDAEILPISGGRVDEDVLAARLRAGGRAIVAIQQVNPETGNSLLYNPTDSVIAQVREADGVFLSDCAQSAGKKSIAQADMVVVSAHKLGGPPGIGALLVRDLGLLEATGGQELGYRGGTENLPGALGFAAALEAGGSPWSVGKELTEAMFAFKDFIGVHDGEIVDGGGPRSIMINAVAMPGLSAAAQLIRLDQAGFAVSAGSACSSGSLKPSRVLKAFGVPDEAAARTIRVSFGWTTTVADIHAFQQAWARLADEARARAA